MAVIKIIILFLAFILASCNSSTTQTKKHPPAADTISNRLIDSIGELAYEDYNAYKDRSAAFLAPIENKTLDSVQREAYIWILINMAYGYQENSRILSSSKFYENALLYDAEHHVLDEENRISYIYKPLANNYTILADYKKAESLQLKALEEAKKSDIKASLHNNLALLYIHSNQLDNAIQYAKEGIHHQPQENYLKVLLYNTLTSAFLTHGQMDSAIIYNQQALNLINKLVINEQIAAGKIFTLEKKAEILTYQENHLLSRKALAEAIALENQYFPTMRIREKAKLYNLLAENHLIDNETKVATRYLKQGKSLMERHVVELNTSSYTKINILKNLGIVYSHANVDSSLYYFEEAIVEDFAFQQNSRNKIDHLRANLWNRQMLEDIYGYLGEIKNLDQEKLTKLLWLTELTKGRLLWNNINRSSPDQAIEATTNEARTQLQELFAIRDLLSDEAELAEINQQIQVLLTDFELEEKYFSRKIKLPDFEVFKSQLQSESLTYSYLLHTDSSCSIFKSENGQITYYKTKDQSLLESISNFKQQYFTTSPQLFNQNPKIYFQQALHLSKMLLPDLPNKNMKLQLSLDNELHILPFDALYHNGKFLVQNFDVQYLPSLLLSHLYDNLIFKNQEINIFFRADYDPPFVDLPFVDQEVKQIRKNYHANAYSYTKLNTARLNQVFTDSSLIHVAAHTIMDTLGEVKLLLHQPISSDQLHYFTVRSPLVVLSACNTAAGTLLPSEGLAGINRAFLSRGIPGVIATQWYANDHVTLLLTEKFYENLAHSKSPIAALSEAKRAYLQNASPNQSNPWYWANMNYTGLETTIDLQVHAGLSVGFWLIFAFVILAIVFFYTKSLRKTLFKKKLKIAQNKPE